MFKVQRFRTLLLAGRPLDLILPVLVSIHRCCNQHDVYAGLAKVTSSRTDERNEDGSITSRLLKKPHMIRCAQSPRVNVPMATPTLIDFSRALPLSLFEQPANIVFHQPASLV
jgi:hypothetical protein